MHANAWNKDLTRKGTTSSLTMEEPTPTKDKEEGGYEFNDEGLNAVWLSGLSGASKCDFGHGSSAQLQN